jgi:hypothetical protein
MSDDLVERLRECSPYGLGLIDAQRTESADRIEAQAALIAELDAALALVTDDETPFHMAYNAAKTARAKVQAAEAWPMPKAVQNG